MKRKQVCISLGIILLIILPISQGESSIQDNREQCKEGYSGLVCYPIDCCGKFVQCVNGVVYPPQVSLFE